MNDTATLWSVNCRWTHRYEMLGIAVGTPNISQESLDAACLQVVIEALGSSTALDRRELTTRVLPARPKRARRHHPRQRLQQLLPGAPADSARQLTAPLRGLGDGALPVN